MISHVMTLANGIIGVSVLAMPFCFKQCGIVLATMVLLLSSMLSRLSCHFLIKSAVMSRRRNFEFLAFHAFGPMGKFLAELCIIGFLLGTCIAFYVVVGDLGPQIIGEIINKSSEEIRTSLLITTGIFVVLPLGLLRNIDSLASVSVASIGFYFILVFRVIAESAPHIFDANWTDKVNYWRPAGFLQCLPIFALALFCQTQLFEIYETVPNATLEKMNQVVKGALNICTSVYFCVGIFGYIAFCTQPFTGNILMSFEPSLNSQIMKIGFILSVVFSFPLVIFPCRASLNSLLFRRGYAHESSTSYITEARFRCITTTIVIIAMIVGILIPNIEFVLGIVGSTMGVIICLIFPAAFFITISTKNTNERLLAQLMVVIGIWILILGTYANLYAMEQSSSTRATATTAKLPSQINEIPQILIEKEVFMKTNKLELSDNLLNIKEKTAKSNIPEKPPESDNARQEPPIPVEQIFESIPKVEKEIIQESIQADPKIVIEDKSNEIDNDLIKQAKLSYDTLQKIKKKHELSNGKENEIQIDAQKNDIIAVDAIKKEETELAADKEIANAESNDSVQRKEQLEKTLQKHIKEQKEMMEEQKEILKDIEQKRKEWQMAEKNKKNEEKLKDSNISNKNNKHSQDIIINNHIEKHIEEQVIEEEKELIKKIEQTVDISKQKEDQKIKNNEEIKVDAVKSFDKIDLMHNNHLEKDLTNKLKIKNDVESSAENSKNLKIHNNKNEIYIPKNQKAQDFNKNSISEIKNSTKISSKVPVKNAEDPIIRALTKQSDKLSNGQQIINVPEKSEIENTVLRTEDVNGIKLDKNKDFSIPIVLKMSNQTKHIPKSENFTIEQNKANNAPLTRDILQKHQREKRMIDPEEKNATDTSVEENKNHAILAEEKSNNIEVCTKEIPVSDKAKDFVYPNDENNPESFIRMSEHLSEQEVIKKVSINPESLINGDFVQLKKRDLKSVKINHNET